MPHRENERGQFAIIDIVCYLMKLLHFYFDETFYQNKLVCHGQQEGDWILDAQKDNTDEVLWMAYVMIVWFPRQYKHIWQVLLNFILSDSHNAKSSLTNQFVKPLILPYFATYATEFTKAKFKCESLKCITRPSVVFSINMAVNIQRSRFHFNFIFPHTCSPEVNKCSPHLWPGIAMLVYPL